MTLYSIKELAEKENVTKHAIHMRIKDGRLKAARIGRMYYISEEEHIKYIKSKFIRHRKGNPIYNKQLLSAKDIAKKYNVNLNRVYYLIKKGTIPFNRIGSAYVINYNTINKLKKEILTTLQKNKSLELHSA